MTPQRDKLLEMIQLDARDARTAAARFSELAGDHTDVTAQALRLAAHEEEGTSHRLMALGCDLPAADTTDLPAIQDEVQNLRDHRKERLDYLGKILDAERENIKREFPHLAL